MQWMSHIFYISRETHVSVFLPSTKIKKNKNKVMVQEHILKFDSYEKQIKVPSVIYAVFEYLLETLPNPPPNPSHSYSRNTHIHTPYCFAYYIVSSFHSTLDKFETYVDEDCPTIFIERLKEDVNSHLNIVKHLVSDCRSNQ